MTFTEALNTDSKNIDKLLDTTEETLDQKIKWIQRYKLLCIKKQQLLNAMALANRNKDYNQMADSQVFLNTVNFQLGNLYNLIWQPPTKK